MIKTLNKRKAASAITIICVIAGFLIGGGRGLSDLRSEAVGVFFDGVEIIAGQSLPVNIHGDLTRYAGVSANLVTVADRHFSDGQAESVRVRDARLALLEKADADNFNAAEVYAAYDELRQAVSALEVLLRDNNITEAIGIIAELGTIDTVIMRQSAVFNRSAEEFNRTLSRFPAFIFRITGLVRPMELFYN